MDITTFSSKYSSDEYARESPQALFPEISLPRPVRFWLLLILLIPSILCTLILLYYFMEDRNLRRPLNNHVIIVLLIVNFHALMIGFPIHLNFLRLGYVWPQIPTTCLAWHFSDIGILSTTGIIMAWASIERHILIFHDQWVSSRRKRFLFHYLPLVIIIVYAVIFYIYEICFPPCQQLFIYSINWCTTPCFTTIQGLTIIFLVVRVIRQKRQLNRRFQWRKLRKMAIQLLSISILYFFLMLPTVVISLAGVCGLPKNALGQSQLYISFTRYFLPLLLPFVCFRALPEVWTKLKESIIFRRNINTITVGTALVSMHPIQQA
ncbi:unnamed protein product [Rotaria sordida]|uniref:G-protein coupled receptors family 1 profile domain-containing protein n=1 Tax=Rotaria sordida TaxID=392033 RepID=A0A818RPY3_9BILA|nr:unnamed protein product [Rotaria sordida]CAF3656547.1 unnamed protein product [Rotaria sordida]